MDDDLIMAMMARQIELQTECIEELVEENKRLKALLNTTETVH